MQCLDNVQSEKYAKFDKHIPCDSRVMSFLTKTPRWAEMMLIKSLVLFLLTCG